MKINILHYLLPTTYYLLLSAKLTSAGPIQGLHQLTEGLRETIIILIRFISDAVLDINSFDEFLFAKIILFTIILLVTYTVIKNNGILGDKESILWIIASAVSILAIRFIPTELLKFALYQYGALGAGLAIFFPFIVFLFFLHQSNIGPMPRKIGWIFFAVSYIAIWAFTKSEIKGTTEYLYWGGILAVAICYIFDKYIHAKFGDIELQKAKAGHDADRYRKIQAKIKEIEDQLSDLSLPTHIRKQSEKTLKYLRKELHNINRRM